MAVRTLEREPNFSLFQENLDEIQGKARPRQKLPTQAVRIIASSGLVLASMTSAVGRVIEILPTIPVEPIRNTVNTDGTVIIDSAVFPDGPIHGTIYSSIPNHNIQE